MSYEYVGDIQLPDGRTLRLLRLEELRRWQDVEPDKVLVTLNGDAIMAKDMDDDARFSFIAAGFIVP
jgi:hypothetical protein